MLGDRGRARRGLVEVARQRPATFPNVEFENSPFEAWTTLIAASMSWSPRRRGIGSIRPTAGAERNVLCVHEDGWRCSATSSFGGRVNRGVRGDRRSPRALRAGNPDSGTPATRGRGAHDGPRLGSPTMVAKACFTRQRCGGTRWCSGSMGRASGTFFVRRRPTADSTAMSVSRSSKRSPSESDRGWGRPGPTPLPLCPTRRPAVRLTREHSDAGPESRLRSATRPVAIMSRSPAVPRTSGRRSRSSSRCRWRSV